MSRAHRKSGTPKVAAPRLPTEGLRTLVTALARLLKPAPPVDWSFGPAGWPGGPPPGSAWERAAERRLSVIEKTLNNQNRLILLTLLSVAADFVVGLTK